MRWFFIGLALGLVVGELRRPPAIQTVRIVGLVTNVEPDYWPPREYSLIVTNCSSTNVTITFPGAR